MIQEIKVLLGDRAGNYTDEQIGLCSKMAIAEVEGYCNRTLDMELEIAATKIALIMLNRLGTEGLVSQGFSGVSESYKDGWPAEVKAVLDRKRLVKLI